MRGKVKKLFLPPCRWARSGILLPPIGLGWPCAFPVGAGFPLKPAFCLLPLSSRPFSGPADSVALKIGDLTIGCHRDHCDVTSRGQVVQGGVKGGSAWLELRDIWDFCPIFMPRKVSVWNWILISEGDLTNFPCVLLGPRCLRTQKKGQ